MDTTNKVYAWFGNNIKNPSIENVGGKVIQYIVALLVTLYIFLLLYTISNDKQSLSENYIQYMFALIFPMTFMFLVILSNDRSTNIKLMGAICFLILITFFISTYFPDFNKIIKDIYYSWFDFDKMEGLSNETSFLITLIIKFILISIIVISLSIVYALFINKTYRQEGYLGFFMYFLFFIPCLLNDFIGFIFKEFKTTPNIVFVLFILEIIFILLYIYLPKKIMERSLEKGKILIKDPLFIGKETLLGGSDFLIKKDDELNQLTSSSIITSNVKNKTMINRNYAISMWLSYNPVVISSDYEKSMPIFRYGITDYENEKSGAPLLLYHSNDIFGIIATNNLGNNEDKTYTTRLHIPPQRWNNIVFNYHNNKVDIFLNGDLERTIELKGAIPDYNKYDQFIAGSTITNIHASLCNVVLMSEPMTQGEIRNSYNLLKLQNPPLLNLL